MEGIIINFRRSRHHTYHNQVVVYPIKELSQEDLKHFIGKKVIYNTGKKAIEGVITSTHGRKGWRVRFSTGMPGQCIGKRVAIKE